ncbi:hypothetical protein ACEPAG_2625 [Sanghuangporus baumii]
MDCVLQIPELLRLIFAHLSSSYQLRCALVCKGWSEIALDVLWCKLDDPLPLFRLLAPWNRSSLILEYERPIRADDWRVFDRYASRVRTLQLDYLSSWRVHDEVYSEVAQKRPHLILLPNLKSLKIIPESRWNLVHSLLFFGHNVRELEFRWVPNLTALTPEYISDFFGECAARMPKLRKFALYGFQVGYIARLQTDVVKLLPAMMDLETFSCSLYFATSATFVALSQLLSLRAITFDYPSKCGIGKAVDIIDFRPTFMNDSFPALVDLSFSATFEDAARFLEMDFAPELKKLFIHSPTLESASQLRLLLSRLLESRNGLVQLCLSSVSSVSGDSSRDEGDWEIDRVTYETLVPLIGFPTLVDFQISYHRPFQLNDAELGMLVENWHDLRVFHFGSDPFLQEKPVLTLAILPTIAKCCPKLQELSLYVDTHVDDPYLRITDPVYPSRFPSIRRIEFGTSPLAEKDIAGFCLYLSDLLPGTCNVETLCGVSWLLEDELVPAGFGIEPEVVPRWKQVSSALRMLITAREQERLRTRDLEREAKDLSMRVAMLEEQRRLGLTAIAERKGSASASVCVHQ